MNKHGFPLTVQIAETGHIRQVTSVGDLPFREPFSVIRFGANTEPSFEEQLANFMLFLRQNYNKLSLEQVKAIRSALPAIETPAPQERSVFDEIFGEKDSVFSKVFGSDSKL